MELKYQTLIAAIQCVESKCRELDRRVDTEGSGIAADLEDLLVTFELAAMDLKKAYQEAQEKFSGLPSYEALINTTI
jgi:hypothetical protein